MNPKSPILDAALAAGQSVSHGVLALCSVLLVAALTERAIFLVLLRGDRRPLPAAARGLYGMLAWVGGIAPMAGLLGTVTGIMQSFAGARADGFDQERLVSGIGLALTATAAGLLLAMAAFSGRALFGRRTDEATHAAARRIA